ncbi:PAS domain-containing sensor histidine kinase [Rhizobium bangladeshense]|uniref:PAS domain-containing sensor histidine kinase n=1 Tax=Rhizobium bangladeshense TaxID=1138189 RepID=UPI001A97E95A|nr:PAS domain S-box protein [Rhizobium bangladeshense]MBX4894481.1 PAS domain S-box protein [Rhizobium bangladeshense]MBY3612662.1 PAS domain S-box protein [Rhizobium bangladeshense]QSY97252.1 PAS domain S-box protein [Rhizobium bangladeshense]
MSNIEEFPVPARKMSEYDALVAAAPSVLDAIPGAVYLCDHDGWLVRYNKEAANLWGRTPPLEDRRERFCGSHALFLQDGTPLDHEVCPMATAVFTGREVRNAEVVIERPDGSRLVALVNVRALKDDEGRIQGAINCFQDISAHKAMEQEVHRKNTDLEDFFENSAIGLHIVGGDGIIQRANKAELALLGYTAEEYVGRHIAEFHADAPVIGDILHKLSCGEKLDRYPARLCAKDGSIKHVLITSNSRFEDGEFLNTRCFTTDVTDLHESESARRDSEERLAATYEAATIGIAEADSAGRLLRVNDALCQMLGRSRDELLSMSFFDYTYGDDREEDATLYARQIVGELDNYVLRKRATKPDGSIVYLDIHSSSVRDKVGGFRYGVRIIQDVTAAKQMEDQIRASEQHMRDLLEALPAAIYTTDQAGRITFYNKAAIQMSGRTPQAGDMWCVTWRLFNPDGTPLPHDQCPMAIALREDRPVRGVEAIAERPDGSRVPFIPYPTPLHDGDGHLVGAINMLVDITERKRAESRQKTLIDELNHRVKNMLATVQSLSGQTARYADDLDDFLRRFEDRLLALSRAHDLLTKRHWEDAPLDSLAREVLMPLAGEAAGRIKVHGPPAALNSRTALSLTMALNELATNAIKYGALSSEAGWLSLTWRLRGEAGAQPRIILEWHEHDGPPVRPPTRRGFGTRLMERCIERDLGGEFDLAFEQAGVACRISIQVGLVDA